MLRVSSTTPGGRALVLATVVALVGPSAAALRAAWTVPAGAPLQPVRSPVGLYGVPASACSLAAAAGFTVVQNYDLEVGSFADSTAFLIRAHAYLDAASRHSLRVLLGLPRTWLRDRREADLRAVIRSLRAHPAVLGWYEDEIASGGDLKSVQFLADLVQEEDPQHGLIIEEGRADRRLASLGRVRMFTYYPVTKAARDAGRLKTLPERLPVDSLRTPFWPVLQAFGRDLISGPAIHKLLAPQPDELRFSLCSAIVHGAGGVFFYPYMHATTYSAVKALTGRFAYGNYKPLPEVAPQLWRAVGDNAALATRLLELTQGTLPAPEAVVVEAPAAVEWRAWKHSEGTLVVLANPVFIRCTVRVQMPAGVTHAWVLQPEGADLRQDAVNGIVSMELPGPGGLALRFDASP